MKVQAGWDLLTPLRLQSEVWEAPYHWGRFSEGVGTSYCRQDGYGLGSTHI